MLGVLAGRPSFCHFFLFFSHLHTHSCPGSSSFSVTVSWFEQIAKSMPQCNNQICINKFILCLLAFRLYFTATFCTSFLSAFLPIFSFIYDITLFHPIRHYTVGRLEPDCTESKHTDSNFPIDFFFWKNDHSFRSLFFYPKSNRTKTEWSFFSFQF